jgi:ribonuclease T1
MSNNPGGPSKRPRRPHRFAPHLGAAIGVLLAVYLAMRPDPIAENQDLPPRSSVAPDSAAESSESRSTCSGHRETPSSRSLIIEDVTILDRDGEVIYEGDIDLTETVKRIEAQERIERFSNDGTVFQNRERRLPDKPRGYYHEWVHPTPDVGGPGPQRIVSGREGEVYYTPDHYQTFQRLR